MGQYLQLGPISCWRAVCPAFSGEFDSGYVHTIPLSHVFLHGRHTCVPYTQKQSSFYMQYHAVMGCKAKSSTTPFRELKKCECTS